MPDRPTLRRNTLMRILRRASAFVRRQRAGDLHQHSVSVTRSALGKDPLSFASYRQRHTAIGALDAANEIAKFNQHQNFRAVMALVEHTDFDASEIPGEQLYTLREVVESTLTEEDAILKVVIMRRLRHTTFTDSTGAAEVLYDSDDTLGEPPANSSKRHA